VIGVVAWLLAFTDWIKTVSDWLKLLGVTAVAGFLFKFIAKHFAKKLKPGGAWLARRSDKLLESRRVLLALLAAIALLFAAASQFGSVWARGEKGKRVWFYDAGGRAIEPVPSEGADHPLKRPYRAGAAGLVRFEGFPAQSFAVRGLRVVSVSPKWSPAAPLAVVHCATALKKGGTYKLQIARRPKSGAAQTLTVAAYHGEPIVLGAEADLVLPDRFKYVASGPFRTPDGGSSRIEPGDTLVATLLRVDAGNAPSESEPVQIPNASNGTYDEVQDVIVQN
jgi:hypothetical protein